MPDITGTVGSDIIDVSLQAGPYRIDALGGNDRIVGSAGDDVILLGQGYDQFAGSGGNDVFLAQSTDWGDKRIFGDTGIDAILGSSGDDIVRLVSFDATNSIELIDGGAGSNVVAGTSGDNILDFSTTQLLSVVWIDAGLGNDRVTGSAGDDVILLGQGYDQVGGGGGNDTFLAQASDWGDKHIVGGAGFDAILGGGGDETIRLANFDASNGLEKIDGGAGANVIAGTAGDNVLDFSATQLVNIARIDAGSGNDRVTGSGGDDLIAGGAGYDTLVGGGGIDTAVYVGAFANYRVTVSGNRATVTSLVNGEGEDVLLDFAYLQFSDQRVRIAATPPPVAAADSATTAEDTAVTVNVLANDTTTGGTLAVTGVTQGAHGAVAILADSTLRYTPAADFFGSDSFTYTVSNGSGTATASVAVTVTSVADPPRPVDDAAVVNAGSTVDIAVLGNDGDPDNDPLAVQGFTQAQHGTVSAGANGALTYAPVAGFVGNDSFTYTVSDGTATAAATVRVTVQPVPPQAVADSATTAEDSAAVIAVLANDTSPSGGPLAVTGVTQGAHGAVAVLADGTVRYTPSAEFFGADSFSYTVSDGLSSATAAVALTVTAAPDAPRPVADTGAVRAGSSVTLDVLANDRDPDGETLAIQGFTQGQHGTVTQNPNGTFTYAAATGYSGADSFTYTVTDPTSRTATANVAITVTSGGTAFEQLLADAPSNSWIRLNANDMHEIWTPVELQPLGGPSGGGFGSPDRVIGAWSAMAWDSNRDQLIFWGGGHASYPGNEIYLWQSSTLEWTRGSLPSEITTVTGGWQEAVDGVDKAPISAHSYDNNEFLPIIDRFAVIGGAAYNTGGSFVRATPDGKRTTGPYLWNPSLADPNKIGGTDGSGHDPSYLGGNMWQNRDTLYPDAPGGQWPGGRQAGHINGVTAYAQENGKDVLYISDGDLWKYTFNDVNDPSQDAFQKVGLFWNGGQDQGAGAIDAESQVFVRTSGASVFTYWDLSQPGGRDVRFMPVDQSGTFPMASLRNFGMDFDPVRDEFVLWDGTEDIWSLKAPSLLSPDGWVLSKRAVLDTPEEPIPPGPTLGFSGVLGKWKYAADYDIFFGVTDRIDGTIWAYKPEDWQPLQMIG